MEFKGPQILIVYIIISFGCLRYFTLWMLKCDFAKRSDNLYMKFFANILIPLIGLALIYDVAVQKISFYNEHIAITERGNFFFMSETTMIHYNDLKSCNKINKLTTYKYKTSITPYYRFTFSDKSFADILEGFFINMKCNHILKEEIEKRGIEFN